MNDFGENFYSSEYFDDSTLATSISYPSPL